MKTRWPGHSLKRLWAPLGTPEARARTSPNDLRIKLTAHMQASGSLTRRRHFCAPDRAPPDTTWAAPSSESDHRHDCREPEEYTTWQLPRGCPTRDDPADAGLQHCRAIRWAPDLRSGELADDDNSLQLVYRLPISEASFIQLWTARPASDLMRGDQDAHGPISRALMLTKLPAFLGTSSPLFGQGHPRLWDPPCHRADAAPATRHQATCPPGRRPHGP